MELHRLKDVHPMNRDNMKAAYFAYLQNTPGSTKAVKECVKKVTNDDEAEKQEDEKSEDTSDEKSGDKSDESKTADEPTTDETTNSDEAGAEA